MATVVLIRPGCTDFDEQNRIQGTLDLPLNTRGEEQVAGTLRELENVPLDVVYTAPCEPARSTAAAIGSEFGVPVKELTGLRNVNQGLWQGLQVDEVRRKYPKVFKQWQESPETICPPEGETITDALERIRKSLNKPLKRNETVCVVASEPLATLIGCLVKGCKPELPDSISGTVELHAIEYLKTNGVPPQIEDADKQKPQKASRRSSSASGTSAST